MTKYKDIEGDLTRDKLIELDKEGWVLVGTFKKPKDKKIECFRNMCISPTYILFKKEGEG